jgi:SAM-dependent methyltransferase
MNNVARQLSRVRNTWNTLGDVDPMWAILTRPDTFGGRWSEEEFFAYGLREIDDLVAKLKRLMLDTDKACALDFGCGIGRLSRALCSHYRHVDGVDVASSMISLASERNLFPESCTFHLNEAPNLALFPNQRFDLIYSRVVLQHISPVLSFEYLQEFARCAKPGGLIVFQLPYRRKFNKASIQRCALYAAYRVLPTEAVKWYRRRKHPGIPRSVVDRLPKIPMEMHTLSKRRVEQALHGCTLIHIEDSTDVNGAFASNTYIFQRRA